MLRAVWSRTRAAMAKASAMARRVFGDTDFAWSFVQLQRGAGLRMLRLYNWAIGVTCGLSLLFGKILGAQLAILSNPEISRSALRILERYIHELLVANLVLLGALLVRGPWAHDARGLLQVLAQRQSRSGAAAVEPRYAQGAVLVARVAVIAPTLMLLALLLAERRPERFIILGSIAFCVITGIVVLSAMTGIAAVHVRRVIPKHAVWAWFGLWLAPEALRLMIPSLPTPRSLIGAILELVSFNWGFH